LCRYASGRRRLDARDQLTLEFAGVFRQYHACLMRTLLVGDATDAQRRMFDACLEALQACEERLVPGNSMGDVYAAHAATFDRLGYGDCRLNACGYSLGAVYPPSWMDWPMFYEANPEPIAPGMVFFLHMILFDARSGNAMTLGRTSIVGETGPEPLSRHPLEIVVR
jgi:Xaa-Pro dipeptidase